MMPEIPAATIGVSEASQGWDANTEESQDMCVPAAAASAAKGESQGSESIGGWGDSQSLGETRPLMLNVVAGTEEDSQPATE
jgi:hypothetical protein